MRAIREFTEDHARALLLLANFQTVKTWCLLNQYWGNDVTSGPWWLVRTDLGLIRLGWRKRVLEIEWSDTSLRAKVHHEATTSEDTYVHAYSYAEAVKYLGTLREMLSALPLATPPEDKGSQDQ